MEFARILTQKASTTFDEVRAIGFKEPNALYNKPAPEPVVSFALGAALSVLGIFLWVRRVRTMKQEMGNVEMKGTLNLRLMLSAFIDNDDAFYTIVKMFAQSFLFLGGLQLNYEVVFAVMLGYFALESCADSLRVLLAFWESKGLDDVVVTSQSIRQKLRQRSTTLSPTNVYEDLSRGRTIVNMVFITQAVLISFVVTDIFDTETHPCKDGTLGCPVVGTLGSWSFYVLGIFMACVFMLGPKTSFGQSEQNPAFWLQLLMFAKLNDSMCTWYDPIKDKITTRVLHPSDWRIWIRFVMSFLINGVGFHILVHALPIQVAAQSSLTGIVFRAVGMMYLVDLDDTPGYKLTLVEAKPEVPKAEVAGMDVAATKTAEKPAAMQEGEMATMAQQIVDDAHAQLDALQGGGHGRMGQKKFTGALAFGAGVRDADGGAADGADEEGGAEEDGGDGGGAEA